MNMEREVSLAEMLSAREARVWRQQELQRQYCLPLISFSLNIAGPIKNSPLLRRVFREGMNRLQDALLASRIRTEHQEEVNVPTGCEALLVVRGDAETVKGICMELEDEDRLGRLFDLDVIGPDGAKLDREGLGHPARPCIVCGKPGKGCASRRLHALDDLRRVTRGTAQEFFAKRDAEDISSQAVRALLFEVCTTPKPGLVDRANNGSHRDMTIFTFLDSTCALLPYFRTAVEIGQKTAALPPEETFRRLRREGIRAERAMSAATDGVNTHKGAIFSLGTVCSAAGRLWMPELPWAAPECVLQECGAMSKTAVDADFASIPATGEPKTAGLRFFLEYGLRGIRGELADGLPGVRDIGLPALRAALAQGATLEQAGTAVLLQLISHVPDTNLLSRGGPEGRDWAAAAAAETAARFQIPSQECLERLDQAFIERNLSPGGCADLLAITYFLHFCSERRLQHRRTQS